MRIKNLAGIALVVLLFISIAGYCSADPDKYYELSVYTDEYGLSFFPEYPPFIGEEVTLRLRTFHPAQKVTLYSDREEEIPMIYRQGHWWGKFKIPEDYKEVGHFFTVWIRYPFNPPPRKRMLTALLKRLGLKKKKCPSWWSKSVVWYKAFRRKGSTDEAEVFMLPGISFEAEEKIPPPVTGEAIEIEVPSSEVSPILIKGSQTISFKSRTLEGSKEGYAPGTQQSREETLRINISGRAADTDIDASLYRTTATGVARIGEREEKISILLRRGSTEAYLGDFTADFTETEFTRLDKVLSGGRLKGDYDHWGFRALYSSPKGESKFSRMYGDATQGPYKLGYSPVVIDSERVSVDGVLQMRGDDYTIDYQAGIVTFIKKTIDTKSIITIYYDYRQTVYQHATYGLRTFYKPNPYLKIGATYLDDSDSLSGAADIRGSMSQEAVDPQGHFVVGVDGSFISEDISADGEIAYSLKNLNLLSASSTKEAGRAAKLNLSASLGPFGLTARAKKIGSKFQPISDANPKQDLWEYGGALSFRPGSLFGSKGSYDYQKYTQSGVVYNNIYKSVTAQLAPPRLPSLEYNFLETDESNDPVTGSSIQRVITRDSAETIHQFGFLSTSLKGTLEKWLRRTPSEEVTDYKKVNFGLATIGLEKVTFSSNIELEDRKEPGGLEPYRRSGNLRFSANPSKQLFISSSINIIDDSAQGRTDVADIAYRVQPSEVFKSDGKYTITSVVEEFPITSEAVSKQTGSFSFDLRPVKSLRLKYLYKPNFTQLLRNNNRTYNNEQQQAEINLIPLKQLLVGAIYKTKRNFSIDKDDYPDYFRKENTSDTDSALYTLKAAPFKILSTEFNYLLENTRTTSLTTTEPVAYSKGSSLSRKFDTIVRTSLSERFSIDSRYTYQKADQGTDEAVSDVVDTESHTGSLKGIWNLSDFWTFSAGGSFSKSTNDLLSQITYTVSPTLGLIYRFEEKLRVDFDYVYSRSFSGATTEKNTYSLRTKYALSNYVNLTLRAEQEISHTPDYRLTDITGNVEINL